MIVTPRPTQAGPSSYPHIRGQPHGHGQWTASTSSESYVGDWRNGRKHGFGLQKFASGDTYEGDFADGKFQDRGKYSYANGDEFMGFWDKGIKTNGTFYFKDGRVSTRRWEKGVLVSCQDFDAQHRHYQPTLTKARVHDPEANKYGVARSNVVASPRGIRTG